MKLAKPTIISIVLFCSNLLPLSSYSQDLESRWFGFERTDNGLMFDGFLTEPSVSAIMPLLRENDTLVVSSDGGRREAATKLGRLIVSNRIMIEVNGSCWSSCAMSIALPAHRTIVRYGSTILFHNTTNSWMTLIARRPELFMPEDIDLIRRFDREQRELIASEGIDPEIFQCIDNAQKPKFEKARRTDAEEMAFRGDTESSVILPSNYDYAWLSPEVFKHFGADNFDIKWTLAVEARQSYQEVMGETIAWVDTPEQCA